MRIWLAGLLALLVSACALPEENLDDDDAVVIEIDGDDELDGAKADGARTIWYTVITKEYFLPSAKIQTEVRKVFKTEAAWQSFFGQPSPGIDFSKNWAIFYTPGTGREDLQQEPGYRARIKSVRLSESGKTLSISTGLELNGDCPRRGTRPFITATIPRQEPAPSTIRLYRSEYVRACE